MASGKTVMKMMWKDFKGIKEKTKKIAKKQEEAYELTSEMDNSLEDYEELSKKVLTGLVGKMIETDLIADSSGRRIAVHRGGIGMFYVTNGKKDGRISPVSMTYHHFFRKFGESLVGKLEGRIPDGKLSVYKSLTKASKTMEYAKNYKSRKRTLVWSVKSGERRKQGRLVLAGDGMDDSDYCELETGEMGVEFFGAKKDDNWQESLSIYDEEHDDEETLYKYALLEQVYDDCEVFLEKAIAHRKKTDEQNQTAIEQLQEDLAPYLALEEL